MATFLNESVLSLPEQVEKNKNDIEEIKETIGGIEPDLVNQVHTNTSDISAIKQEQTLQNTAINNNTNKTQNINANGTEYSNVEKIKNELSPIQIKGNGVSIENDDITEIFTPNANIVIANSGVVEIKNDNNANKLKYNMANGDFIVEGSHTLKYNSATGELTIDGGAVGGQQLYLHRLCLTKTIEIGSHQYTIRCFIEALKTTSTAMTISDVYQYFIDNLLTASNSRYLTGQLVINGVYNSCKLYYDYGTIQIIYWDGSSSVTTTNPTLYFDNVIPIN